MNNKTRNIVMFTMPEVFLQKDGDKFAINYNKKYVKHL